MAGRFVWHDLMTHDAEKAETFYTQLFGWIVKPMDMGELGTYRMLHAGEEGIGGIVQMPAEDPVPPHWMAYVDVPDIDAALATTRRMGGSVLVPATPIPGVGRFAVIADPTGGAVSPMQFDQSSPEPTQPTLFGFCWDELMTLDPDRAQAFYSELFGWRWQGLDMGPMGTYFLALRAPDKQSGGLMKTPPDGPQMSYWMSYVFVPSVDEWAGKAQALGATLLVPPMDIPNIGRFAVLQDPVGATFALYRNLEA